MTTAAAAVSVVWSEGVGVLPEDHARAGLYGLLACLFYTPPSAHLLDSICDYRLVDDTVAESRLATAWRALREVMRTADPAAIKQEYDDTFISTGRAPVSLFASAHLAGYLREAPLAQLREELARLGLARKSSSAETEDHVSALCDAMRFLILGNETPPPAALDAQRAFFMRHLAPWYASLCDAILQAPGTDFYRKVAAFARAFFDLEVESFEIA